MYYVRSSLLGMAGAVKFSWVPSEFVLQSGHKSRAILGGHMLRLIVGACALLALSSTAQAVSISYTDEIANPDYFNGFEGMAEFNRLSGGYHDDYTEGGITVSQINGDFNGIWNTYPLDGREGSRIWYPNGGDAGHTRIRLESGENFGDIGFLAGSGGPTWLAYSLFDDEVEVASGVIEHTTSFSYLSFLGGGFDTVFLRSSYDSSGTAFSDDSFNGLALDSIEATTVAPVPAPPAVLLFLSGLGLMGFFRWRGKRQVQAAA